MIAANLPGMAKKKVNSAPARERQNVYFGIRCDRVLVEKLRRRARANDRNVGAELNRILRKALEQDAKGGE